MNRILIVSAILVLNATAAFAASVEGSQADAGCAARCAACTHAAWHQMGSQASPDMKGSFFGPKGGDIRKFAPADEKSAMATNRIEVARKTTDVTVGPKGGITQKTPNHQQADSDTSASVASSYCSQYATPAPRSFNQKGVFPTVNDAREQADMACLAACQGK